MHCHFFEDAIASMKVTITLFKNQIKQPKLCKSVKCILRILKITTGEGVEMEFSPAILFHFAPTVTHIKRKRIRFCEPQV